jgi:hypothetical protein
MTDSTTEIATFVAVSSLLTGIAANKLAPLLDPTDVKTLYFNYAKQQGAAELQQLLDIFLANKDKPDAEIAASIFASNVAWFARSVMLEWYLSAWYDPDALAQYAAQANDPTRSCIDPPQQPNSTVISSVAYTQGWAWNVAQAHPMGFSNFRFGYWSANPPSLTAFVGGGK